MRQLSCVPPGGSRGFLGCLGLLEFLLAALEDSSRASACLGSSGWLLRVPRVSLLAFLLVALESSSGILLVALEGSSGASACLGSCRPEKSMGLIQINQNETKVMNITSPFCFC